MPIQGINSKTHPFGFDYRIYFQFFSTKGNKHQYEIKRLDVIE